jgi:hypothetical protein
LACDAVFPVDATSSGRFAAAATPRCTSRRRGSPHTSSRTRTLRKYFFDGVDIQPGDPDYERAVTIAELFLNYLEHIAVLSDSFGERNVPALQRFLRTTLARSRCCGVHLAREPARRIRTRCTRISVAGSGRGIAASGRSRTCVGAPAAAAEGHIFSAAHIERSQLDASAAVDARFSRRTLCSS